MQFTDQKVERPLESSSANSKPTRDLVRVKHQEHSSLGKQTKEIKVSLFILFADKTDSKYGYLETEDKVNMCSIRFQGTQGRKENFI